MLIHGESGTGKELVARAIHRASKRASGPFVEVNCAAIPQELIESELFGHEKGSFTGATGMKRGKFELAHNGTIFLDEIADMSLATQAKVLRVLEGQEFQRVGGTKTLKADVRVIAASNKDLAEEIRKGTFREDLYYRLNVIPLEVPPLRRAAATTFPLLVRHFLKEFSTEYGQKPKTIDDEALALFLRYPWPGNVRELRNIIERLIIMVPGPVLAVRTFRRRSAAAGQDGSDGRCRPGQERARPCTAQGRAGGVRARVHHAEAQGIRRERQPHRRRHRRRAQQPAPQDQGAGDRVGRLSRMQF